MARVDRVRAGSEIRTARRVTGRSLEEVAKASGMSESQVGRIERGVSVHFAVHLQPRRALAQ